MDHKKYLLMALDLAKEAFEKGSVPVGAVIVDKNGEVLASGFNEIKLTDDPTAHAEVVCMRRALAKVISKKNPEPTFLYTTLEPCFACGFFITRTNIKNVVWALNDPYKGGIDFLKSTDKLKSDFESITMLEEPEEDIKHESKKLMRQYYLGKGDTKTADLFL